MELKEVFQIIKNKIWIILILLVIFIGSAYFYSIKQKDTYQTSSILTVQASKEKTDEYQYGGYYALQASDLFINTINGWIKSSNIVLEVYKNSGIEISEGQTKGLGKNIYSQKIPPQNLILTVTEENQERSILIAQSTIDLIKDKTSQLNLIANSASNFEIVNSELITISTKTNLFLNLIISFIISLFLSLVIIFFLEYISPTINNIQRTKNVFKKMPIILNDLKIKNLANQESKQAEKFRLIRANITSSKNAQDIFIVSSVGEKTNNSLISANLALSFARAGKRTILVDANFTNPSIHEFFGKPNEFGFSEFLFDEKNIEKYLQKTEDANLRIMPSGIKLAYASDTIERSNLKSVFEKLKEEGDIIIINIPPLDSSSEAFPLFSIIKKALILIKLNKSNLSSANYLNSFLEKKEVEKHIVLV